MPHHRHHVMRMFNISWHALHVGAISTMSSAYNSSELISLPMIDILRLAFLIFVARSLTNNENKVHERVSPWQTPDLTVNQLISLPVTLTQLTGEEYMALMGLYMCPHMSFSHSLYDRNTWLMYLKTFWKSINVQKVSSTVKNVSCRSRTYFLLHVTRFSFHPSSCTGYGCLGSLLIGLLGL